MNVSTGSVGAMCPRNTDGSSVQPMQREKMIYIIPVPRGILSSIHKIALVSIICVFYELRICKYRYLYVSISINTENGYIYIDVYRCEISTTVVCVYPFLHFIENKA